MQYGTLKLKNGITLTGRLSDGTLAGKQFIRVEIFDKNGSVTQEELINPEAVNAIYFIDFDPSDDFAKDYMKKNPSQVKFRSKFDLTPTKIEDMVYDKTDPMINK
ncbi:MAG: hypothetical protein ACE5I1_03910 [bacterium]